MKPKTQKLTLLVILGIVGIVGYTIYALNLEAQYRNRSVNNLKMLGLALHNYHEVYSMLPPASIVREDGTTTRGWNTIILPFVDMAPLYNSMDSDNDWNTVRNLSAARNHVPVYQNDAIDQQFDEHGKSLVHYSANKHLFQPNGSMGLRDMKDGTATTLMVGEIVEGLPPWIQPGNVRDPMLGLNKNANTFGSPFSGGVFFMFGDGSVKFIPDDIDPAILEALSTIDGGEQLEPLLFEK